LLFITLDGHVRFNANPADSGIAGAAGLPPMKGVQLTPA